MEPEPNLHAHLFVPVLHDGGEMSIEDLIAAAATLPRKSNLVIGWVKSAIEAGLVERAIDQEKRDHRGRQVPPRLYRLTQAGREQVDGYVALVRHDEEFLSRLEGLGPGQTAETLSNQKNDIGIEYVTLWIESAYARGLVRRTERGEPFKAQLTDAGAERLAGF